MSQRFPSNPFEDVQPSEFNKYTKKHASEHFLDENFRKIGWEVFEPFTDTGIDRIIRKKICPNNHTKYDDVTNNIKKCECGEPLKTITRFLQIKTRKLDTKKNAKNLELLKYRYLGYTLESADFRTDPRHVFVFYSDNTTKTQQDVHIIPIADYLQFFIDNDIPNANGNSPANTQFAVRSFREGQGKDNFLFYKPDNTWVYNPQGRSKKDASGNIVGKISNEIPFNDWLNEKGLEKISNHVIENDMITLQDTITTQKLQLFYRFTKGRSNTITHENVQTIRTHFQENQLVENYSETLQQQREATIVTLQQLLEDEPELKESIKKYLIQFKEMRNKLEI
tara:strand:- start:514 stop:1527 length:1014 start_codon:yes stop_codon:yes gene_type:complete